MVNMHEYSYYNGFVLSSVLQIIWSKHCKSFISIQFGNEAIYTGIVDLHVVSH